MNNTAHSQHVASSGRAVGVCCSTPAVRESYLPRGALGHLSHNLQDASSRQTHQTSPGMVCFLQAFCCHKSSLGNSNSRPRHRPHRPKNTVDITTALIMMRNSLLANTRILSPMPSGQSRARILQKPTWPAVRRDALASSLSAGGGVNLLAHSLNRSVCFPTDSYP